MTSKIHTAAVYGIDGISIDVEVDIAHGMPAFTIVGLPETSVKESKERVRAAIRNAGFEFPADRITVNLAPADVRKEGSSFDLPIAMGILAAMNVINREKLSRYIVAGELSLDGRVKGVRGILPVALRAAQEGATHIIVPHENGREASIVRGINVFGVTHLIDVVHHFRDNAALACFTYEKNDEEKPIINEGMDFSEIRGNGHVKRALEIAASGGHNVLMIGPPGSGKTMIARRLPTILPSLSYDEAIETTKIHSIAGFLGNNGGLIRQRPFRAPHHTISDAGLIGGGPVPKPGEVSLSHNGVLFLDEFPEFRRNAIDGMRQPLEDGFVTISRVNHALTFPARFMLVAAMNPCPCGYWGDTRRACMCSGTQIRRYRAKISGPLLDRIDIHIEVPAVTINELSKESKEESSPDIRKRVVRARSVQEERFKEKTIFANSQMTTRMLKKFCSLDSDGRLLLEQAVERFAFSPRAYHRILKVSRTIADLDASERISGVHIAEAIQYRVLDRGSIL